MVFRGFSGVQCELNQWVFSDCLGFLVGFNQWGFCGSLRGLVGFAGVLVGIQLGLVGFSCV